MEGLLVRPFGDQQASNNERFEPTAQEEQLKRECKCYPEFIKRLCLPIMLVFPRWGCYERFERVDIWGETTGDAVRFAGRQFDRGRLACTVPAGGSVSSDREQVPRTAAPNAQFGVAAQPTGAVRPGTTAAPQSAARRGHCERRRLLANHGPRPMQGGHLADNSEQLVPKLASMHVRLRLSLPKTTSAGDQTTDHRLRSVAERSHETL